MAKYVLALLVIVALALGVYYSLTGKFPSLDNLVLNKTPFQDKVIPIKTAIPTLTLNTSDESLDNDLTALEKELADIEKDNSLTQELNSL